MQRPGIPFSQTWNVACASGPAAFAAASRQVCCCCSHAVLDCFSACPFTSACRYWRPLPAARSSKTKCYYQKHVCRPLHNVPTLRAAASLNQLGDLRSHHLDVIQCSTTLIGLGVLGRCRPPIRHVCNLDRLKLPSWGDLDAFGDVRVAGLLSLASASTTWYIPPRPDFICVRSREFAATAYPTAALREAKWTLADCGLCFAPRLADCFTPTIHLDPIETRTTLRTNWKRPGHGPSTGHAWA